MTWPDAWGALAWGLAAALAFLLVASLWGDGGIGLPVWAAATVAAVMAGATVVLAWRAGRDRTRGRLLEEREAGEAHGTP